MGGKSPHRPVLVLPLHGHLAPAAWALRREARRRELRRSATCRPAEGRCPGRSRRDVAELRERGLLCRPHHRGARLRRRARGDLGRRGARRRRARLGWDAALVGPGPGIIGSDSELGHGGMAALDSAHAALALGLPTLLSPRLSSADPRERHRGVSHHTRHGARAAAGAGRGRRARRARTARSRPWPRSLRRAPPAARQRAPSTSTATRPAGLPARTMGRGIEEDPLFFAPARRLAAPRAPPCAARDEGRPGEPPGMAIAVKPPGRPRRAARRRASASRASSSTSSPTWSWSGASRATR